MHTRTPRIKDNEIVNRNLINYVLCGEVCVYDTSMCAHMLTEANGRQYLIQLLSILLFRTEFESKPGAHQFSQIGWPVSSRNQPITASPVLGL